MGTSKYLNGVGQQNDFLMESSSVERRLGNSVDASVQGKLAQSLLQEAKVLIVDDEKANVRLLEIILQEAGYSHVYSTTDSRQALPLYIGIVPDILLLDLNMPGIDGFGIMRELGDRQLAHCPILVLTADARIAVKHRALQEGASDFITKPFDDVEVLLRIKSLLAAHFHSSHLEELVRDRTLDLERSQIDTVQRLALAAEYRDDSTGMHTKRVGRLSMMIARALGLSAPEVELIELAAPLHDVGKIALPDAILLKPGKLTEEEFAVVKQHVLVGARILSGSNSQLLKIAEEIAMYHHERWDGHGYLGIAEEEIPLHGRIVCVADVFDALTNERPYKEAWPTEKAIEEIRAMSGRQFDPRVVDAFLGSLREERIESETGATDRIIPPQELRRAV